MVLPLPESDHGQFTEQVDVHWTELLHDVSVNGWKSQSNNHKGAQNTKQCCVFFSGWETF